MLSSHADSPLSQACSSFIFHHGNESLCGNRSFLDTTEQRQQGSENQQFTSNAQVNNLPESRLIDKYFEFVNSDGEEESELIPYGKRIVDNVEPDKHNISSSSSNTSTKPALVHTVSTYRKQQQQLRLNGTNSSSKVSVVHNINLLLYISIRYKFILQFFKLVLSINQLVRSQISVDINQLSSFYFT